VVAGRRNDFAQPARFMLSCRLTGANLPDNAFSVRLAPMRWELARDGARKTRTVIISSKLLSDSRILLLTLLLIAVI